MSTQQTVETKAKNQKTAEALGVLLAETYALYLKTQNFHWNVTGPYFESLHKMFEGQYGELAAAVDEIAERIRSLGAKAPGSYREFAALSTLPEAKGGESWQEMVASLSEGHEALRERAKTVLPLADEIQDEVTTDLLVGRMSVHEKTGWMLKSTLE